MTVVTPRSFMRRASDLAVMPASVTQPRVVTMPSRASMPTAMRPGHARQASCTSSGCSAAAVPMMHRLIPASIRSSMSSMVRSPPPSSTGPPKAAATSFSSGRWDVLP